MKKLEAAEAQITRLGARLEAVVAASISKAFREHEQFQ